MDIPNPEPRVPVDLSQYWSQVETLTVVQDFCPELWGTVETLTMTSSSRPCDCASDSPHYCPWFLTALCVCILLTLVDTLSLA